MHDLHVYASNHKLQNNAAENVLFLFTLTEFYNKMYLAVFYDGKKSVYIYIIYAAFKWFDVHKLKRTTSVWVAYCL